MLDLNMMVIYLLNIISNDFLHSVENINFLISFKWF